MGVGPAEFFGEGARGERWCRRCPVIELCFWWAVVAEAAVGLHFGIWGGAGPAVRQQVLAVTGAGPARACLDVALSEWAQRRSAAAAKSSAP